MSTTVIAQQTPSVLPEITWEELETHCTEGDFWVAFKGNVYDATNWAPVHPGQFDVIHYAAGKDITNLFSSYHKMSSEKVFGSPMCPRVGTVKTSKFPVYPEPDLFYKSLKVKAEKYFTENGIKNVRALSWFQFFNSIFIFSGLLFCLIAACYSNLPFLVKCLAAVGGGTFYFLSLTHIWHQVSHTAYSANKFVWKMSYWAGGIITGQDMYVWMHRHVFGHHIYTNVAGVDPDIAIYKCSSDEPVYKYRTSYLIVPWYVQCWMYVFSTFQMQLDDYFSFFRGSMESIKINDTGVGKTLSFLFCKFIFYLHRVILPIALGFGIFNTFVMLAIHMAVSGILFGYFSQITHISDDRTWATTFNCGWGEMQVLTACDYAQDSYFWTYLSGYLNYQVTHHLFPSMASHHHPALYKIVVETCAEFKIEYTEYKTFWEACKRHLEHVSTFESEGTGDSIVTMFGRVFGFIGDREIVAKQVDGIKNINSLEATL
jgi:fatty acid desaturase/predicted heme/steroid binding protein